MVGINKGSFDIVIGLVTLFVFLCFAVWDLYLCGSGERRGGKMRNEAKGGCVDRIVRCEVVLFVLYAVLVTGIAACVSWGWFFFLLGPEGIFGYFVVWSKVSHLHVGLWLVV